jgi:pyruvate dehydrogenase E1 component beta subunit
VLLEEGEDASAIGSGSGAPAPRRPLPQPPRWRRPEAAPARLPLHRFKRRRRRSDPDIPAGTEMVATTVREALRDAMAEEMRRDGDVFVMGEEVAEYQGAYKITQGLLDEFGESA